MERSIAMLGAALFCSIAGNARSELLEMRQVIYGMDCSSCSHPLGIALKKLPGVEWVEVSLERGEAHIRFAPGNTLTVDDVQDVIRKAGFEAKDVQLWVAGTVMEREGLVAVAVGRAVFSVGPPDKAAEIKKLGSRKAIRLHGHLQGDEKPAGSSVLVVEGIDDLTMNP